MIDFTLCEINKFRAYGGANGNKINILYGGNSYMPVQREFYTVMISERKTKIIDYSMEQLMKRESQKLKQAENQGLLS